MKVQQLRDFYNVKNNNQLAQKIKCVRSNISYWEKNGIPLRTQALFEIKTQGKLKADLEISA